VVSNFWLIVAVVAAVLAMALRLIIDMGGLQGGATTDSSSPCLCLGEGSCSMEVLGHGGMWQGSCSGS
jgi:hypothetical protein